MAKAFQQLKRNSRFQIGFAVIALFFIWFLGFRKVDVGDGADAAKDAQADVVDVVKVAVDELGLRVPYFKAGHMDSENWLIQGDTVVKNDEYVRLTSEVKDQAGSIFSKKGIASDGFEVQISFNIHGNAKKNGLKGDGFAVFLTDEILPQGTVFGSQDKFNGLGLFVDTYKNGASRARPGFPLITLMKGDGVTYYDKLNDGEANELASCGARGIYKSHHKNKNYDPSNRTFLRLTYTKNDGYVSVSYRVGGAAGASDDDWVNCFTITDVRDLPPVKYLGISAATGDLTEIVDLYDVGVFELRSRATGEPIASFTAHAEYAINHGNGHSARGKKQVNRRAKKLARARNAKNRVWNRPPADQDQPGLTVGTVFLFLWKCIKYLFLVITVVIILYIGFVAYRVRQKRLKQSRRRSGGAGGILM